MMKPWIASVLSATILNPTTTEIDGFINPGFCPFPEHLSKDNLLEI